MKEIVGDQLAPGIIEKLTKLVSISSTQFSINEIPDRSVIEQVPEFGSGRVRMKDPESVAKKLDALVDGGMERLQVIADFDMTLSRYHLNGTRCLTSYGVLEASPLYNEEFRKKFIDLHDKYYPIEICHEMTTEQKIPLMEEWYRTGNALIVEMGLNLDIIRQAVRTVNVHLR
jgi:5'-nucleotidase